MQLRDLELFCSVAVQRSFSKAAKDHGLSQSVASETIKALEERLGVELLDRSKRPLEVTYAGRVYLDGCRGLLEGYRQLEDRMRQLHHKIVGPVRVAAIYSVGLLQMDCYVKQFERLHPDAALELRYLHPDEVLERVLNEEVDLGLVSYPPRRGELSCTPWQEQPLVVVVYPGHRLAGRSTIQVCELEGEALVSYTPELQIRSELDRRLKQAKVHVDIVHEFDNIENIKRAVEIGSGIAVIPAPTARREVEIGSLRALQLTDAKWTRPLTILQKKTRNPTTAVSRFLELLHEDPVTFMPRPAAVAHPVAAAGLLPGALPVSGAS